MPELSEKREIGYLEAASILGVGPRQARRILIQWQHVAPAYRYGYRRVCFIEADVRRIVAIQERAARISAELIRRP